MTKKNWFKGITTTAVALAMAGKAFLLPALAIDYDLADGNVYVSGKQSWQDINNISEESEITVHQSGSDLTGNSIHITDADSTVTLTSDLYTSSSIVITGSGTLDLNGKKIENNGSSSVIVVQESESETSTNTATITSSNGMGTITGGAGSTIGATTHTGTEEIKAGGGIQNSGDLTVKNVIITGNTAVDAGGGIYSQDGSLKIENCEITNNSAGKSGGGVQISSEVTADTTNYDAEILNTTIQNNTAVTGGGLYLDNGYDTDGSYLEANYLIKDSTISDNQTTSTEYDDTAANGGGLISMAYTNVTITGQTMISGNKATSGAGIYTFGNMTIGDADSKVTITQNEATYGGGIYQVSPDHDTTLTINQADITDNTASFGGGGIMNISSTIIDDPLESSKTSNSYISTTVLNGGTISGNTSEYGYGGGIYNSYGSVIVNGGSITGNKASYGGGVYNVGFDDKLDAANPVNHWATFQQNGGKLYGNSAKTAGDDIYNGVYGSLSLIGVGQMGLDYHYNGWYIDGSDLSGNRFGLDSEHQLLTGLLAPDNAESLQPSYTLNTVSALKAAAVYTVTFVDDDGETVLKATTNYLPDAMPVAPDAPEKAADDKYSYTFTGWSATVSAVTGNVVYQAVYAKTPLQGEDPDEGQEETVEPTPALPEIPEIPDFSPTVRPEKPATTPTVTPNDTIEDVIEDAQVPLAPTPDVSMPDEAETNDTTIADEQVPAAALPGEVTPVTSVPKTGAGCTAAAPAGLLAAAAVLIAKNKKKRS